MTIFSVSQKFYIPLVMTTTGVLMVFVPLRVLGLVKPKTLYLSLGAFFFIGALIVTGYEINRVFHNSIPTVNEQGVNLKLYQPFQANTKAVSLPEASTLKITTDLPVIDGATALYPLYSAFAQATYPEKEYSFLFFATEMIGNNQIRLLKIDGVFPDKTSIKNNTYPQAADFYAVTAGSKNPNTEALIKWILSPQGQYIVGKTGYTPIK